MVIYLERKIIVKNGENYELDKLVIEEEDFHYTKYYTDNLPCLYNYLDGGNYKSFEDCVNKLGYDYKKDPCELSILLNRILDNDNPLIISDTFKKLVNYNPHVGIEQCVYEGLLEHFSLKRDLENTSVPIDEYMVIDEDGKFIELNPILEEEVKKFGEDVAKFKAGK